MKTYFKLLSMVCLFFVACGRQPESKMAPGDLFNGKDFTNWVEPQNNIWWSIENGILSAKSDAGKKGSTLWTARKYTNFELELDFRLGDGTVDSGVFLRTEHEQIQLGISGSLKRDMTCSPYISGKGYPVEAQRIPELLLPKDWNHLQIRAAGAQYTVWLNGEKVMSYTSETAEKSGPIGLQLHPNREMDVFFRNIKIEEISVDQ